MLQITELARGIPGALVGLSLFLAVGALTRSAAEPPLTSETEEPARLCGEPHGSRGESAALDLEAVSTAYAALQKSLAFTVKGMKVDPGEILGRPFDLGLPACRGNSSRRVRLKEPLPPATRGARLLFLRGDSRSWTPADSTLARDPGTEILLVSAARLRDVSELSDRLGRRVTLAPAALVRALGIRCATTAVTFSEKGDEALLAEGD